MRGDLLVSVCVCLFLLMLGKLAAIGRGAAMTVTHVVLVGVLLLVSIWDAYRRW